MLSGLLQQPYVLAVAVALLTATGMFFYTRSIDNDPAKCKKAFFKTLVVGLAAGLGLAWLSGRSAGGGVTALGGGAPEVSTEPFMPPEPVVVPGGGAMASA